MYISIFRVQNTVHYFHQTNTKIQEVQKRFTDILKLKQWTKGFHEAWSLYMHLSLWPFSTNHLHSLSCSMYPTHLFSSLKSPQLPCCVLLVNPSIAPCLMLPPAPQTALITGVYPHGAGTALQPCCQKARLYFSLALSLHTQIWSNEIWEAVAH